MAGDLHVGDTTVVQTPEPVDVTIVGIATFGDADGLGETTFTAFDLATAQSTSRRCRPDDVDPRRRRGRGVRRRARDRIAAVLPDGVEAITGGDLADEQLAAAGFVD